MQNKNKILLLLLALVLFLSAGCTAEPEPQTEEMTCAQASEFISVSASRYYDSITPAFLLESIPDSAERKKQFITRAEAFVMLDRAFSNLPDPVGDWLRIAPQAAVYNDIPNWAEHALDNLNKAGILYVVRDNLLSGGDTMERTELDTILRRIYALLGTNLKDDFYTAVNKEFLDKSVLSGNSVATDTFEGMAEKAHNQFSEMYGKILNGLWEKGTPDRKIVDFYESFVNMDARNAAGAKPLKQYLDILDSAVNLSDLERAQVKIMDELAFYPLFNFILIMNEKTNNDFIVTFFVRHNDSLAGTDIDSSAFRIDLRNVQKLFELADDPNPAESTKTAINTAIALADARYEKLLPEGAEKNLKPYTMQQLQDLFPNANMQNLLDSTGLKPEAVYYVPESSESVMKKLASLYNDENVGALRQYIKYLLLMEYYSKLSQDFIDVFTLYKNSDPIDEQGRSTVLKNLGGYLDSEYIKLFFSKEEKQYVESIVFAFIEDCKSHIMSLDWLTGETKRTAVKKLDTMVVKVGGMEEYNLIDDMDIRASGDGGSYFTNTAVITRAKRAQDNLKQGLPLDRYGYWLVSPYEIAAAYYPQLNEIVISAAVLQAPFFDINAALEENLAGIGWVIAHEITHSFDLNGSKYDEYGNITDWWTKTDKEKYQKLCEKVIKHYDGYEVAPGITVNGVNTIGENTADLGGIRSALNHLKKTIDNPDYTLFFTSAAKIWEATHTRSYLESSAVSGIHSPPKARVNKLFQNFQEFYDAFNIQEGDAMYVPPDLRVKIW